MNIKNKSNHPIHILKPLLKFGRQGIRDSCVEIHIRNSKRGFCGRAYSDPQAINLKRLHKDVRYGMYGVSVDKSTRYLITLNLPEKQTSNNFNQYPYWKKLKRLQLAYPEGFPFDSWDDQVIHIVAHEFRHIWKFQRSKKGKGEYDAEMHALKILNRWREVTGRYAVQKAKQPNPFTNNVFIEIENTITNGSGKN